MQTTAIQVNLGMISLNETEVTKKLAGVGRHHRRADDDRRHLRHELQEHAGARLGVGLSGVARRRCSSSTSALLALQEDRSGFDGRVSAACAMPLVQVQACRRRAIGVTRDHPLVRRRLMPRRLQRHVVDVDSRSASSRCAASERSAATRCGSRISRCADSADAVAASSARRAGRARRRRPERASARARSPRKSRCAGTPSISTPVDCASSRHVERRISSDTSERQDRIDRHPSGDDDDGAGDDRRHRAQQVAEARAAARRAC